MITRNLGGPTYGSPTVIGEDDWGGYETVTDDSRFWSHTAVADGFLSFDTVLSPSTTGFNEVLVYDTAGPTVIADLIDTAIVEVTSGHTYIIETRVFGTTNLVMRVSQRAEVPPWVTPPDRTMTTEADPSYIFTAGYHNIGVAPSWEHDFRYLWDEDYASFNHYLGGWTVTNAFGGVNPTSNPSMQDGGHLDQSMPLFAQTDTYGLSFLTSDGSGSGGLAPPFWVPGPFAASYASTSGEFQDGLVTATFQAAQVLFGHHTTSIEIRDHSQAVSLWRERYEAGATLGYSVSDLLGFAGWTDPYDSIEVEDALPGISTVEVMPDYDAGRWTDLATSGPGVINTYLDAVTWLVGLTRQATGTLPEADGWGPYARQSVAGGVADNVWQKGGALGTTPWELLAPPAGPAYTELSPTYDGTTQTWIMLDSTLVADAVAQEDTDAAALVAAGGAYADPSYISKHTFGLQLIAMTPVANMGDFPATDSTSTRITSHRGQSGVWCWTRIQFTPSRIRVIPIPVVSPIVLDPIRLTPRDDTLGNAPVARNWPPDVSTARNWPIMP